MRIGEIAIVGPHAPTKRDFIRNISDEVVIQTDDLIFGRLRVNNQLLLHLYGVNYVHGNHSPSWDLVSEKLLGYIILFNWERSEFYENVKTLVDDLTSKQSAPLVVAANVQDLNEAMPQEFMNIGINLASSCEFTFCDATSREGSKKALVILLDAILEKMA